MTEQFAFEQFFGQGGTVYDHEWVISPPAPFVNPFGKNVFAGTTFTGEQNRGITFSRLLRGFKQTDHDMAG
jgi:hypothetical protein